jgi:hypothetical protein
MFRFLGVWIIMARIFRNLAPCLLASSFTFLWLRGTSRFPPFHLLSKIIIKFEITTVKKTL